MLLVKEEGIPPRSFGEVHGPIRQLYQFAWIPTMLGKQHDSAVNPSLSSPQTTSTLVIS